MTIAEKIDNAIDRANSIASLWAGEMIDAANRGEDLGCCERKLFVLNMWACILNDYKINNFDSNGSSSDVVLECVELADINTLISKINSIECRI